MTPVHSIFNEFSPIMIPNSPFLDNPDDLTDHLLFANLFDFFPSNKKKGSALAACKGNISFARLARAIDHATHDRYAKGLFDVTYHFLNFSRGFFHVVLQPAARGA